MKNCLLPAALFGSIALVSYILPAAALSPVEIQRIAEQTTVQINGCEFGSGVIIRRNGNTYTVLTVAHAVRKSGCRVMTPDSMKYPVERIKTFPNSVDLAVFTFSSNKDYPVAKLIDNSDRVEVGETIYVSGFPLSTAIKSSVFTSVKGDVVANPPTQQQEKGYSLIYSNNTLPGQSGGPVWNNKGEVIAIHGQGDVDSNSQATINAEVRVKTGYNLGITVNTFNQLAATAGISGYTPGTLTTKSKLADDLIASALVKLDIDDYQGMLDDLNRAISLEPQNARAYYVRGIAKENLRDKQGALADYSQAIVVNPNYAVAYFYRGNIKSKLGDQRGAIADYGRSIDLKPNFIDAYLKRGQAKGKLDEYEGAIADYNRVIAIDRNSADAYFFRGYEKERSGNKRGAIQDMSKAAELFKQQGNAESYRISKNMLDGMKSMLQIQESMPKPGVFPNP